MEDPIPQDQHSQNLLNKHQQLPPTPPLTDDNGSDQNSLCDEPELPPLPISNLPKDVLAIDKNTPDAHVPRDPRLIRLTGVHPFNVEAPLTALFNDGFLTSTELFYVRNHGAVPEVRNQDIPDWELKVEG